jgi:para-nitrobenzyl esterase
MRFHATAWRLRWRIGAGVVVAGALVAGTTLATSGHAGASASSALGTAARPAAKPIVLTRSGAVQGSVVNGITEFKGIPYAAPPVGSLRWHAPEPPAHWRGVRPATAFGPHCPQLGGVFGSGSNTSENCLFLNVYTKAGGNPLGRPVMFWVHGGALVSGESDAYNPVSLVNDGVTVVTINYRLGALGFLADSALANAQGDAGNYGLMDQQLALRWVQQNIRGFNGDPRDVTLFGESAGGLSTLSQLDSPLARGLFQKAIIESGSYDLVQAPLAAAEQSGAQFAAKVGCTQSTPAQVAACLRAVPVATLVADENQGGYTPDLDGLVLRQSILTALQTGEFSRVPVIMGTNHDEWRLFVAIGVLETHQQVTAANYLQQIQGLTGATAAQAQQIAGLYPLSEFGGNAGEAIGAVGTDRIFACPSLTAVDALSKFTPTFAYEFSDPNPPSQIPASAVGFPTGDFHGSELAFVFDPVAGQASQLSAGQARLSKQMQAYWSSQARHGNPETAGQPAWPLFNATSQRVLTLTEPSPVVETNFSAEHNCSFWASFQAG